MTQEERALSGRLFDARCDELIAIKHRAHVLCREFNRLEEDDPKRTELLKQLLGKTGDIVSYTSGKEYWGMQHIVQIAQFYRAVLGQEELEISGREALKIQKIICDIYNNNDTPLN